MTDDPGTRPTILLVEDDPAVRGFLATELAADGYLTVAASTVEEGRELLESAFPDLALVDLCLPDGSGLDLLRSVRGADGIASRVDPRTPGPRPVRAGVGGRPAARLRPGL
jgi:CheY-like chemotaxis protein